MEKNIIETQNLKEDSIDFTTGDMISGRRLQFHFTDKFGLIIMDQYQKNILFITKIETH